MKKRNLIYIFIIALLSISCSSDDDSINNEEIEVALNPPEWIRGVWVSETFNENGDYGWEFTNDDAKQITGGSVSFSLKDRTETMIWEALYRNPESNVTQNSFLRENSGEDFYKITEISYGFSSGNKIEFDYYFEKENSTTIIRKKGPGYEDYVLTKKE